MKGLLPVLAAIAVLLSLCVPALPPTKNEAAAVQRIKVIANGIADNLKTAKAEQVKLEDDLDAMKEWGVAQQAEAHKYERAYSRVTWPLAILAGAAVFAALMHFTFIPASYRVLGSLVLSAAAVAAVKLQIAHYAFQP